MKYYKQIKDNQIISVEAKSIKSASPNFIQATKAEYDGFIASLPTPEPSQPVRDLGADIDKINEKLAGYDELKAKVEALEKK